LRNKYVGSIVDNYLFHLYVCMYVNPRYSKVRTMYTVLGRSVIRYEISGVGTWIVDTWIEMERERERERESEREFVSFIVFC